MGWFRISIKMWLLRRPRVMSAVFTFFKNLPGFSPLKMGMVLDAAVARDILMRGSDFEVSPTSAPKMLAGDFIHGMDKLPRYELDRSQIREVLSNKANLDRVRRFAIDNLDRVLSGPCPWDRPGKKQKIDLFSCFVQPVVTKTILEFYGLDFSNYKSDVIKGDALQRSYRLIRLIGTLIALPHPAPYGRYQAAVDATKGEKGLIREMKRQIAAYFEQNPQGTQVGDGTVIEQFIGMEVNNDSVDKVDKVLKRLFGILATSTAINKLFINILEELLRRRDKELHLRDEYIATTLDQLIQLVNEPVHTSGSPMKAQVKMRSRLRGYLLELLRFNIAFPGIPRHCPRATSLTTPDGKTFDVKKGSELTTLLPAVMFDNQTWPEPDKFCPHRNQGAYMHFGWGQHMCLGMDVSLILLEEIFIKFLQIDGVRGMRLAGKVNDGPTYDAFYVYMGDKND